MTDAQLVAFLQRPLTAYETTNKDLYLKIANDSLEELICTNLCDDDDPKIYSAREGYSTVFTDFFTDVNEVQINGTVIDPSKYSIRQWDKRNASWYNSIVFDSRFTSCKEVQVSASWGFDSMPTDLQAVLAGLFGLITKKNKYDSSVASKQVEDFRVSFKTDSDLDAEFYSMYEGTLRKYSLCNISNLQHGDIDCGC